MMEQEPTAGQLEVGPEYAPGIRGWLAFFSLGVWAMPLILSFYSIQGWVDASHEFQKSSGRPLNFSTVYLLLQLVPDNWGAAFFFVMIGMYVTMIGASIWLITQWWRRQRLFPRNWIVFQVCLVVISIIILVLANEAQAVQPRDVFSAVVNILFWWRSKRVAATFTQ